MRSLYVPLSVVKLELLLGHDQRPLHLLQLPDHVVWVVHGVRYLEQLFQLVPLWMERILYRGVF